MKRSALPLVRGVYGPSAQVPQVARRAVLSPGVRAIGRPVIGHHRLHRDALGAEPGPRPLQEGQGIALAVTGPHLGVGQPRVVVDGHVHMLPARARGCGSPHRG